MVTTISDSVSLGKFYLSRALSRASAPLPLPRLVDATRVKRFGYGLVGCAALILCTRVTCALYRVRRNVGCSQVVDELCQQTGIIAQDCLTRVDQEADNFVDQCHLEGLFMEQEDHDVRLPSDTDIVLYQGGGGDQYSIYGTAPPTVILRGDRPSNPVSTSTEADNYMVVRRMHRRLYVTTIVQQAKNRFGRPQATAANRLAVRKFLLDLMTEHKLRPTHINVMIDLALELVFVANDSELSADEIARCYSAVRRGGKQTGVVGWLYWVFRQCTGYQPSYAEI